MSILDIFKKRKKPRLRVLSGSGRERIKREWKEIEKLAGLGKPSARKEVLIRADKLMDFALKQISFGETMGQRLKNAKDAFPWKVYDGLWKAHKMRNKLVHEAGFEPPYYVIEKALERYKTAFRELKVDL